MIRKIELTRFEKESRDALRLVQAYLAPGRLPSSSPKRDWYRLMDTIKRAVDHLDCKEIGCPMGLHRTDCTCKENVAGENFAGFKTKIRKLIEANKRKGRI